MNLNTMPVRFAWLLMLIALAPIAAIAQSEPRVEVTLHTPVTQVRRGQTLPVTVIVQSTEERRRTVLRGDPGFTEAGGIELVAIDEAGTEFRLSPTRSEWTRDQVRSGDRRVVLEPRTGFGMQRRVRAADWFPRAGRYELVASYASPLPVEGNRSVIEGDIEGSVGTSLPVVIEVMQ